VKVLWQILDMIEATDGIKVTPGISGDIINTEGLM
jgi:hypothetical protein